MRGNGEKKGGGIDFLWILCIEGGQGKKVEEGKERRRKEEEEERVWKMRKTKTTKEERVRADRDREKKERRNKLCVRVSSKWIWTR